MMQVVMCSNCGRAGVIQSFETFTSRSMFFCSCGSPVMPATPAQLLTALSRGATVAAAAAAAAASQRTGVSQHVSYVRSLWCLFVFRLLVLSLFVKEGE